MDGMPWKVQVFVRPEAEKLKVRHPWKTMGFFNGPNLSNLIAVGNHPWILYSSPKCWNRASTFKIKGWGKTRVKTRVPESRWPSFASCEFSLKKGLRIGKNTQHIPTNLTRGPGMLFQILRTLRNMSEFRNLSHSYLKTSFQLDWPGAMWHPKKNNLKMTESVANWTCGQKCVLHMQIYIYMYLYIHVCAFT